MKQVALVVATFGMPALMHAEPCPQDSVPTPPPPSRTVSLSDVGIDGLPQAWWQPVPPLGLFQCREEKNPEYPQKWGSVHAIKSCVHDDYFLTISVVHRGDIVRQHQGRVVERWTYEGIDLDKYLRLHGTREVDALHTQVIRLSRREATANPPEIAVEEVLTSSLGSNGESAVRDGVTATWKGGFTSYCRYQGGLKHGRCVEWDQHGLLMSDTTYDHGRTIGDAIGIEHNGGITKTHYDDSFTISERRHWHANGWLAWEETFAGRQGMRRTFDHEGHVESAGPLLDGDPEGVWRRWRGCELASEDVYVNGRLVSTGHEVLPDGTILQVAVSDRAIPPSRLPRTSMPWRRLTMSVGWGVMSRDGGYSAEGAISLGGVFGRAPEPLSGQTRGWRPALSAELVSSVCFSDEAACGSHFLYGISMQLGYGITESAGGGRLQLPGFEAYARVAPFIDSNRDVGARVGLGIKFFALPRAIWTGEAKNELSDDPAVAKMMAAFFPFLNMSMLEFTAELRDAPGGLKPSYGFLAGFGF